MATNYAQPRSVTRTVVIRNIKNKRAHAISVPRPTAGQIWPRGSRGK